MNDRRFNAGPTPRLIRNPTAQWPAEPRPNWLLRIALGVAFVAIVISTNPEILAL